MILNQRKFILSSVILCATLLLSFQNCGQVAISAMSKPPELLAAKTNITASSCVNAKSLSPENTKFVFVIDLSRSNIGDFTPSASGYYYFHENLGTDIKGARFDALTSFIEGCGGTDTEYSVIGFSDKAGKLTTSSNGGKTLACEPVFESGAQAIQKLNELKSLQLSESVIYKQFVEPTTPYASAPVEPLLSKQTNYVAATDCMSQTIENDIMSASAAVNYQVFFISDGEAYFLEGGCEAKSITDKVQCYTDKMAKNLDYTMKLAAARSKNVLIHALYYTKSGSTNSSIANYMQYLSTTGQTREPINLGEMNNAANGTENKFCKLLSVAKSIVFKSSSIVAVNLNKIKIGNKIYDDSDADGLVDDEDPEPYNPRSMASGVLDGVCKILGGREKCVAERQKINCNPSLINQFNISDCDVKILKLDQLAMNPNMIGIDSDNDGIPDYIEILKGTNPASADSNLDPDNDGQTNIEEISLGHDLFTPDKNTVPFVTFDLSFNENLDGCANGGWTYQLKSINTTEGKNDMLFYFKTIAQNSINDSEFKSFHLNVNTTVNPKVASELVTSSSVQSIQPIDFISVEKVVSP